MKSFNFFTCYFILYRNLPKCNCKNGNLKIKQERFNILFDLKWICFDFVSAGKWEKYTLDEPETNIF